MWIVVLIICKLRIVALSELGGSHSGTCPFYFSCTIFSTFGIVRCKEILYMVNFISDPSTGGIDASKHNRYLIYRMLGREITFSNPSGTKQCRGIAENISRDIFSNMVELTVNGRLFRFREPVVITANGNVIMFIYGKVAETDCSDEGLFNDMRAAVYKGETAGDIIKRTTPPKTKIMRFYMGEKVA